MIERRLGLLAKAALALLLLGAGGPLFAAPGASVDIEVTIVGAMSVSIDDAGSSTHTTSWNTSVPNMQLVSQGSSTVTNDAVGIAERWALSTNANSLNTVGNPESWTLVASTHPAAPGADEFALQAVFGSTNTASGGCPSVGAAAWDHGSAKPLTTTPTLYTSQVFAAPSLALGGAKSEPDLTVGAADGLMFAGSKRALCWRLIAPSATTTTDTQNVQITITAVAP